MTFNDDLRRKPPRPTITPARSRRAEIPADGKYEASLACLAPLVRRCDDCGKLCCATIGGVVLWHKAVHRFDGTEHECPGVGRIGVEVNPRERHLEYVPQGYAGQARRGG